MQGELLIMFTDRRIERHQLPYYLRVFNSVTDKPVGFLGNVSADGLMLISQLPMMVGMDFQLRLKVPARDGGQQVIDFSACCVWCHEDATPLHYDAGFTLRRDHGLSSLTRAVPLAGLKKPPQARSLK